MVQFDTCSKRLNGIFLYIKGYLEHAGTGWHSSFGASPGHQILTVKYLILFAFPSILTHTGPQSGPQIK